MTAETQLFATETELEDAAPASEVQTKQFLVFESDNLLFGADVEHVMEIITNYVITPLPIVPSYIRGIINLRGQIIPILDIRLRLGKPPSEVSCVIVLDVHGTYIGILVDGVAQMESVPRDNLLPVPERNAQELVSGMCSLQDGSTMLILDCELLVEP